MAISDLEYAILSLDSYNRGPDPGVTGLGGPVSTIGSLTLLNIPVPAGSAEASFYAAAYLNGGTIVISYRGTDDPTLGADLNAWTGGGGFQTRQAELAAEFYYRRAVGCVFSRTTHPQTHPAKPLTNPYLKTQHTT